MLYAYCSVYAIQIVAKFYKVQYERHAKRDVVSCPFVFGANFRGCDVTAKN